MADSFESSELSMDTFDMSSNEAPATFTNKNDHKHTNHRGARPSVTNLIRSFDINTSGLEPRRKVKVISNKKQMS